MTEPRIDEKSGMPARPPIQYQLSVPHGANLFEFVLKIIVAGVVMSATYLLIRAKVIEQMMTHPVVFCLMLDCFLIHVCTNASKCEALVTGCLGTMAFLFWLMLFHGSAVQLWAAAATFGCLLGLASLLVLSVSALKRQGAAGRDQLRAFGRSSVFLCMAIWGIPILSIANTIRPEKFDGILYRFDAGFGVQPSFLIGQIFASSRMVHGFEYAIYVSLALPVGLLYIGHLRHNVKWPIDVLQALLVNSLIGYLLFWVFPAAGPSFAFPQSYPLHSPALSAMGVKPIVFDALPNAMPSVHVSTALLIWFNCRPWPRGRLLALAFLVCTILSTLGLGEHYLVDVIVAFPYALLIQSLSVSRAPDRGSLLLGLSLTAGWIIFLKFGYMLFPTPALAYGLSVTTVVLALWQESKLGRSIYAMSGSFSVESGNAQPILVD